MSVGIPNPLNLNVDLDVVGPVEVSGIPSTYHINLDHLPKIQIGLDPLTINPITLNPMDVSVRLKEFPSIRTHLPADFRLGFSVFGFQLVCLRVCGEAQVITEPYVPNPCERCEPEERQPREHVELPKAEDARIVPKKAKRKR
jgi:hypothetical protein